MKNRTPHASDRRTTVLLAAILASLAPAARLCAEDIRVKPYDDVARIARTAKPGDTLLLYPGAFNSIVLENIRGEPGRPITLRNVPSVDAPVDIDARNAAVGLRLIDCAHLRLENIAIREANEAGLVIEGVRGKSFDISLDRVRVTRAAESAENCGIVVRNASQIRSTRAVIAGFGAAAVRVARSESVAFETTQIVARPSLPSRIGFEVSDGSSKVEIAKSWIRGTLGAAFALGTAPGAPVADCTVWMARADACHGLIDLGSALAFSVRQCTAKDTKGSLWRVVPPAGQPSPRGAIESCVFTWIPGELQRLSTVAEGADTQDIALDGVLVWSRELAAGSIDLGAPAGVARSPLIRDLDPKLDDAGYATEPTAEKLGLQRTRPKDAPPPLEPSAPPNSIAK